MHNKQHNKALHPTAYSFAPSFVPHFVATLPAAGELGVVSLRLLRCVKQAVLWPLEVGCFVRGLASSALAAGAAASLWRGVWVSAGETKQQQHNKALHPTARSVVVFAALSLDW